MITTTSPRSMWFVTLSNARTGSGRDFTWNVLHTLSMLIIMSFTPGPVLPLRTWQRSVEAKLHRPCQHGTVVDVDLHVDLHVDRTSGDPAMARFLVGNSCNWTTPRRSNQHHPQAASPRCRPRYPCICAESSLASAPTPEIWCDLRRRMKVRPMA